MTRRVITPEEIQRRIEEDLPGARVEIIDLTGTQDHYEVRVVAEAFSSLNALERHRRVYSIFDDVIGGALHALSLKLSAPTG